VEQYCAWSADTHYAIIQVDTAEAAIKKALAIRPDVILLEAQLPDADGIDVCRRLKVIPPTQNIPILLLSTSDELERKLAAFAAGVVDYIHKPVPAAELLARMTVHTTIQRTRAELHQSENRFRTLVEQSVQGVLVLQNDQIVFANQTAVAMTGYSYDELLVMTPNEVYQLIHPEDRDMIRHYQKLRLQGVAMPERRIFRGIRKDGAVRWLESFATLIHYHDQPAIQLAFLDTTEQREAEARVRQMNQHLARTAVDLETLHRMSQILQRADTRQAAIDGIVPLLRELFSEQIGMLYLRRPQSDILERSGSWGDGDPRASSLSCSICELQSQAPPCDRDLLDGCKTGYCDCRKVARSCVPVVNDGVTLGAIQMRRPANLPQPVREHGDWMAGMVADLLGLALSNIELRDQLREESLRDPLTGLFNRRFLDEVLRREVHQATRYQRPIGIIMMDIDYFKAINDTYGHHTGDLVLQALSSYLQQRIRRGDMACRYGGEELMLVLPGASLSFTCERALDICNEVRRLHEFADWKGILPPISISVGVAAFPNHGLTPTNLINAADTALYQAKHQGRDQMCMAAPL
jgi:diguanylate cyclase (GGDEF)-like protein/PAS domain S-box-containing protein